MPSHRTLARALATPAALLALAASAAPAVAGEPAPRWRAPELLTTSDYGVNGMAAAGSERGGEVLVWGGNLASSTVLVAERAAGARAWSAPRPIAEECRAGDSAPIVAAANAAGDAVAAWVCADLAPSAITYRLQAARRPAGGAWQPATTVAPGLPAAPALDLAVTAAGDAVLLWAETGVGIRTADLPAGGAWGAPRTLAPLAPLLPAGDVDLALRPDGSGAATWLAGMGTATTVDLARRAADGAWSAAETASTGARAYYPAVAALDDGSLVVAWTDGALGPGVSARARAAAGTWSETATIGRGYGPRLDAVPGGRAVITWSDGGYPRQSVRVASRRPGAAWVQAGALPMTISEARRGWDVDVDPAGDVLVATTDRAPAVLAARLDAGATALGPATTLSNPSQVRPGKPAVLARPDGEAVVAWSGFVPPGALGRERGGTAVQAADLSRRSSRPPLVTQTVLGRVNAGKVRVAEHALLRLSATFARYAGPVPVVVQRFVAGRWRAVGRAVARNEDSIALRLTGPGPARLRLAYRSGARTRYAPVVGVRVTRPANPRIPAGTYPGNAVVAGDVLWSIAAEGGSGRSVVRAFDARSGRRLRAPIAAPGSRLLAVGGRAWLASFDSAQVTPLDVAAPGGLGAPITLPGMPVAVAARGDLAWMVFSCFGSPGCLGVVLQRIDPDSGAAIGPALPVGGGPIALGPDALWTTKALPCGDESCEDARPFEAERRDPLTGEVIETGGNLGALAGAHGVPDGELTATAGALWARTSFGTIVRRGVDGSVGNVSGTGYTSLAADGPRLLALRGDGVLATIDGATGRVERRRSVGVKYLSDSGMAVAPRAVWVTSPGEGALIRVGR